jgi:hypothetical protein
MYLSGYKYCLVRDQILHKALWSFMEFDHVANRYIYLCFDRLITWPTGIYFPIYTLKWSLFLKQYHELKLNTILWLIKAFLNEIFTNLWSTPTMHNAGDLLQIHSPVCPGFSLIFRVGGGNEIVGGTWGPKARWGVSPRGGYPPSR